MGDYIIHKLSDRCHKGRKIAIFGPWVGEFGWEMMKWQPGIRGYAEKFPERYLVVISEPGHEVLYEKADEFWDIPEKWLEKMDTQDFVRETSRLLPRNNSAKRLKKFKETISEARDKQAADIFGKVHDKNISYRRTIKWRKYVKLKADFPVPEDPYFCVAPRQRPLNQYKNYPKEDWVEIIDRVSDELGLKWKAVGRPHEVRMLDPDFEIKKRDNLSRSVALFGNAEFSIVPESGAGFLSLMCGCPTVIFSHEKWRNRYCNKENPLNTPIEFIGDRRRKYTVDQIVDRTLNWVK
jgi:hypothetical protein